MFKLLETGRASRLKRAYTTRRVPHDLVVGLAAEGTPDSGDVCIARVTKIGQHTRLESPDGRRQTMFIGDEILVVYANRYAPAQYEAVVPDTIGPCDLVAAGGVAASALCSHSSKAQPTQIDVLGFATDEFGRRIRLDDHRLAPRTTDGERPFTIVVAGTSMDSGKTTTAAGLIRGLVGAGHSVGAAKVTGTGAGGDIWLMSDAGASPCLDFTSVGMASTYLMGHDRIRESFATLTAHLADARVDVSVVEIADGLYQDETRDLLASGHVTQTADAIVFAAGDAAGAASGVEQLWSLGVPVSAVSGLLTASPLAVRETQRIVDVPVLPLDRLENADHDLQPAGQHTSTMGRGDRVLIGTS